MLFTTVLLAGLASAAPALDSRQLTTEYAPWEITWFSAGTPSGRPGSSNESRLQLNINDPNSIRLRPVSGGGYTVFPPFEASCSWSWVGAANFPTGVETLCTPVDSTISTYGNFTMTLAGQSQRDFVVSIKETRELEGFPTTYVRAFEAEQAFNMDENLSQNCGGSGVCSWQVRNGLLPIEVQQELTRSV